MDPAGLSLKLAYAYEPHTTATHLQRALARLVPVVVEGPGHPSAPPREADRLLWVESGGTWLPDLEQLSTVPAGAWIIDSHRGAGWRARLAWAFDVVFGAQEDFVAAVRALGVRAEWLPMAAPAELCGPGPDLGSRSYDVAFVGQRPPGSPRATIVDALQERFSFAPVDGFVPPDRMMDLYRSARVVVNLPWAGDLNMRTFEATGARALLVTGPAQSLDTALPPETYVQVDDLSSAAWVTAVERVLGDPDAQARADRAYEHVVATHTYDHRAARVLEVLDAAAKRGIAPGDRAAGLASAYARWGRLSSVTTLPLGWAGRSRFVAETLVWKGLSLGNQARRRARSLAGRSLRSGHADLSLRSGHAGLSLRSGHAGRRWRRG
jgi:Glycosyl transferases group 1